MPRTLPTNDSGALPTEALWLGGAWARAALTVSQWIWKNVKGTRRASDAEEKFHCLVGVHV